MSDRTDVTLARNAANADRENAQMYGSAIEDGRPSDPALAILLAAEAVCAELRALAITVEYEVATLTAATGRA